MPIWIAKCHGFWVILLVKLMRPSIVALLHHTNYAEFTLRVRVRPKEDHRLILQPRSYKP